MGFLNRTALVRKGLRGQLCRPIFIAYFYKGWGNNPDFINISAPLIRKNTSRIFILHEIQSLLTIEGGVKP